MKSFLIKWHCFFALLLGVVTAYVTMVNGDVSGDLGILARIPFGHDYDIRVRSLDYTRDLKTELVDIDSASVYPVLLIGDSFTEPENVLGHNISSTIGDTVRVICDISFTNNYMPTQVLLYGLKHDCFRPGQTIILESIGRLLMNRFAELDYNDCGKPERLRPTANWRTSQANRLHDIDERRERGGDTHNPFTFNELLTWIRTKLGYKAAVKHCKLTHKMFDHDEYGDELYYSKDDLTLCNMPQRNLDQIAAGVNNFFIMAENQGVNLYLLLTPDKFDLYYPYIKDPSKPRPNVLDFLKGVDPRYADRIINTRDSLAPYLERGTMDLYRLNDSHWSIFAAEEMGRVVAEKIKNSK